MRGKTRAATRFNKFKEDITSKFSNSSRNLRAGEGFSHFAHFLEYSVNFEEGIKAYCDKDECLLFEKSNIVTALYQIFRLADRPVLLRDLEGLADKLDKTRIPLYTALSTLIGVNLLDYRLLEINGNLEDSLQFFIKDE